MRGVAITCVGLGKIISVSLFGAGRRVNSDIFELQKCVVLRFGPSHLPQTPVSTMPVSTMPVSTNFGYFDFFGLFVCFLSWQKLLFA